MKSFFFAERKLVFRTDNLEKQDNSKEGADIMDSGLIDDATTVHSILNESQSLRDKLDKSDVFNDEDKAKWKQKIESAKAKANPEELKKLALEFEQTQSKLQNAVKHFTQQVLAHKTDALTEKTAQEYMDWMPKQNTEMKFKAAKEIVPDIEDRISMRKRLSKRFNKADVYQMERTEMRDKVKQLEQMERNDAKYESLIKGNERYFHNPKEYIKQFKDQTLDEQERWLGAFKEEYLKPRKALVDIYDKLPAKYKNDSEFLKVGLEGKQKFLDKLDMKIEQDYIKQVNETNSKVMSQNSKRFAIVDFLRLNDVGMKAMYLDQLPKSIKAETKLAKEYKDLNKKFKDPNKNKTIELPQYSEKEWEKLKFEEKEKLLLQMKAEVKLIEAFARILKQGLKDNAISEKTYERYMKIFSGTDLNGRSQLSKNSLSAMKTRRDLVEDFEKLDKETKNKFKDFYKRGHKARLQIFKEAQLFETKNKAAKDEEELKKQEEEKKDSKLKEGANVPQSLEQKDVQTIVSEMQKEADAFEATQQLERALDKHQDVLKLHPDNQYSKKKQNELKDEIEAMDTLMDDEIEEAVNREMQGSTMQEELDQIRLAQMILDDREEVVMKNHGVEDLGKQKAHLAQDTFTRDVHEKLHTQSGGKKSLDKDGKVQKVETIDLGTFGKKDKADVQKYKNIFKTLKARDNIVNIKLVNEQEGSGDQNIQGGKKQMEKRIQEAKKRVVKKTKSPVSKDSINNIASKRIDEELMTF